MGLKICVSMGERNRRLDCEISSVGPRHPTRGFAEVEQHASAKRAMYHTKWPVGTTQ